MDPLKSEVRILELDGLRGIAVSMVLVWHFLGAILATDLGQWAQAVRQVLIFGRTGVDLFFVLSGFLIIGILVDRKRSISRFSTFYMRRLLRIVPPYVALLLLFWIPVAAGVRNTVFGDEIPLWSHLSFTQNWLMAQQNSYGPGGFSVTWSVAIEEQFYLIFPLVVAFVPQRRLALTLAMLAVASAASRTLLYAIYGNGFAPYVLTPFRLDGLCMGGLVALLWRNNSYVRKLKDGRHAVLTVLLFFAAGIFLLLAGINRDVAWHMHLWGHTYLALLYSLTLIVILAYLGERHTAALRNRWLRSMGRISYGVYLFHPLILGCVFLMVGRPEKIASITDAFFASFALAATIFVCWILYRFIETPCLRLAARFRYGGDVNRMSQTQAKANA